MPIPHLSHSFFYPVKSLRGIEKTSVEITMRGPKGDRLWMIVDQNNIFLSQRSTPKLAAISAIPDGRGGLTLKNGAEQHAVPNPADRGINVTATVWRDRCSAWDAGGEAATWLSNILQRPVRLVRIDDDKKRPVNPDFGRAGDEVGFADAYPVLITNAASLAALDPHFTSPIAMDRFRPNLVIRGARAFEEDNWRQIRIGTILFDIVKPCDRCATTIVDQVSGEATPKEPLKTLAKLRRGANGGVYFGQNAIPRNLGTIAVGAAVEIIESGPPHLLVANVAMGPQS